MGLKERSPEPATYYSIALSPVRAVISLFCLGEMDSFMQSFNKASASVKLVWLDNFNFTTILFLFLLCRHLAKHKTMHVGMANFSVEAESLSAQEAEANAAFEARGTKLTTFQRQSSHLASSGCGGWFCTLHRKRPIANGAHWRFQKGISGGF